MRKEEDKYSESGDWVNGSEDANTFEKLKVGDPNTPESKELIKRIKLFCAEYRQKNPNASDREVRRVAKRKLNIKIV